MAESKFARIAKMFGLELEEVFHVRGGVFPYKFTSEGLCYQNNIGEWLHSDGTFLRILRGGEEIIMPPYRPQRGDLYWSYIYSEWVVASSDWIGDSIDYARLEAGMVFRTQEEALAARAELYKKVTGKEYNSNDYR